MNQQIVSEFKHGLTLLYTDRSEEALNVFNNALARSPKEALLHGAVCEAQFYLGNFVESIESGFLALELGNLIPSQVSALASALVGAGEQAAARSLVNSYLTAFENDVDLLTTKALIEFSSESIEESKRLALLALEQDANWQPAHCLLGSISLMNRDFKRALEYFIAAEKLKPGNQPAVCGIIECLFQTSKHQLVIKMCEGRAKRFQKNEYVATRYGMSLSSVGRKPEAEKVLSEVAENSETYYPPLILGAFHHSNRDKEKSLEGFRRASAKCDDPQIRRKIDALL